jgi:hypothetical protein
MAAPGHVTIVLWSWPAGERLSHRGWSGEPVRDANHPAAQHRFLIDVPAWCAEEVARITPLAHKLSDERQ